MESGFQEAAQRRAGRGFLLPLLLVYAAFVLSGIVYRGVITFLPQHLEELVDTDLAARYAPLDRLSLSPQCGFSSTVEGNTLTVEQELGKLRLVVETAQEILG